MFLATVYLLQEVMQLPCVLRNYEAFLGVTIWQSVLLKGTVAGNVLQSNPICYHFCDAAELNDHNRGPTDQ
jgi:hypothetical protein